MALSAAEQGSLRLQIFSELEALIDARGGFLVTAELLNFEVNGRRMPLIDRARGIRNPVEFDSTLSIVSAGDGPYSDHVGSDGLLRYAFQAKDPLAGDNRKLRNAMATGTPLVLFEKPSAGIYIPIIGARVVGEEFESGYFVIAVDDAVGLHQGAEEAQRLNKRYAGCDEASASTSLPGKSDCRLRTRLRDLQAQTS